MDTFQALQDLENSMRDLIEFVLSRKLKSPWQDNLKISPERRTAWSKKMGEETVRLRGKSLDNRLLYFADFYDLKTILDKHWGDGFSEVFPSLKWITHFLDEVERLRNAQAHGRGLLQHQKHLLIGISGEIRTQIMLYRGNRQDMDSYFPVIEAISDSLGFIKSNPGGYGWKADNVVGVGDSVEVRVSSTDPMGEPLEYSISKYYTPGTEHWSTESWAVICFNESDVGKECNIHIKIRTRRKHHAHRYYDDSTTLIYHVRPNLA